MSFRCRKTQTPRVYNAEKHKVFVANWFADFQGSIHADADPFFETLAITEGVTMSYCNAHSRRKFEPIAKAVKTDGLARHAMKVYRLLYKIEREAKNNKLTPEKRHQLRQEKSKPILKDLKIWLDQHYPTVLPKSPLGKAMSYCIKHWDGLIHFLSDGRLEIDNNLTEQSIKPFVIARKNFLFSDSVAGAKALCMHFSIARTAISHGFDPYHYYVTIFKALPHCETLEDYEALLPWNLKAINAASKSEAA